MQAIDTHQEHPSSISIESIVYSSSSSSESLILEEDGGPHIDNEDLITNPKLLSRYVASINKKMHKYAKKLER